MKIGIIQGRLSKPKEGFQECPINWQRELLLLSTIDLNHVEWIVTEKNYWKNPIFSGANINKELVSSICVDFLVGPVFHDSTKFHAYMNPVCDAAERRGINNITIPLLEDSSVMDLKTRNVFIENLLPYLERYGNLNFSIEAELGHNELMDIVSLSDKLFITYDTGNMTSHGVNHSEYIEVVKEKLNNVHLKDRTYNAVTVPPGEGDTDFASIFKELKRIGYDGNFTIQTARGKSGEEVETIQKHKHYFKELYNG
tara:strand:- start:3275 stop:4039 length:765 start_codon:yes stop_codon:yes gene_type:complete